MKLSPLKLALLSAAMATGVLATQASAAPLKDADRALILKAVDADAPQIQDAAMKIWGFAELGYQETKSSAVLQDQLKAPALTSRPAWPAMPTAFLASFKTGRAR
jgi:aminobenzoyl-glutamate utilization protein B